MTLKPCVMQIFFYCSRVNSQSGTKVLYAICDYIIFNEKSLNVVSLKSVCYKVCAGIGSRLGLGLTKALVQINGRSLISWQLELFKDVEDIRIVIGFQANDIIEEVRKHRQDVIFIFNHRYF